MAALRRSYDDPFGYGSYGQDQGYGQQSYQPPGGQSTGTTTETPKPELPGPTPTPQPPPQTYAMDAGWDQNKLADPTHGTAKYDIGRVLRGYDPTKGITSDVLAGLNKLGLATFSGSGDRLSLNGVTDAGRAEGLDSHDFNGDFIRNYTGTNPNDHSGAKWGYDWYDTNPQQQLQTGNAAALGMGGGGAGAGYGGANGGGSGSGSGSYHSGPVDFPGLREALTSLFSGGGFNQDIVNRRTENAKENLLRQRKSQLSNDQAYLADRGLMGSGPEVTALKKLDANTDAGYQNAVSGIYADESGAADKRMAEALSTAAGMTETDAQHIIDQFRSETERQQVGNQYSLGLGNLANEGRQTDLGFLNANNQFTLGRGNLALGNMNGQNSYNLGLGQQGLARDQLLQAGHNGDLDHMIALLQLQLQGAQLSGNGHQ